MEQRLFDTLTRTLGQGLSRRGLGIFAGMLASTMLAGADARKKKKKCRDGLLTCKVKRGKKNKILCVVAQSDASNCGACGNVCANGLPCVNGVCASPPSPPPPCQPKTCATLGAVCGSQTDGCGGALACTCSAGSLCDDGGMCRRCDVCASDCDHATIQAAVDAAESGDTIHICAGAYTKENGSIVIIDGKSLKLVGAGSGANGATIEGNDVTRNEPLVRIRNNSELDLRDVAVTGGIGGDNGGAIGNAGALTLTRVLLTANSAGFGGGIWTMGSVTLNAGAEVTFNNAFDGGGIYMSSGGTAVTLNAGSRVTNNMANQQLGAGGGIFGSVGLTINPGATVSNNEPDDCFPNACPQS